MYIGEFAALTGVTPKTIRYYESIGLLPEALRDGKYRVYDHTYVETVIQIKRAQDLGFNLAEIKSHTQEANIKKGLPASIICEAIECKRAQIKSEIKKLQSKDHLLQQLQTELTQSSCQLDSAL